VTITDSLTYDTLDFLGKPTIGIQKKDVFSVIHNENFKVYYRYKQRYLLLKPVLMSLTIFVFYLLAIAFNRVKLSFNEMPASKVKDS